MELNFHKMPTALRLSEIGPFQQAHAVVPQLCQAEYFIFFDKDKAVIFDPTIKPVMVARLDLAKTVYLLPLQDEHPKILPHIPFHTANNTII